MALNNDINMDNIHIHRTKEGTVFECVAAVIILIMWGIIAYYFKVLPEQIPTHFDLAGNADDFGSKHTLWILGIVGTFITALILTTAYHPRFISMPVKVTKSVQMAMAIRGLRITGILVALLFVDIVPMIACNLDVYTIAMWCLVVAMFVVNIYYSVCIMRTKA